MAIKKAAAANVKKTIFTKKKAIAAVKAAKQAKAKRHGGQSSAWKEGGREWSRVLGHFGSSSAGSSHK